MPAIEGLRDFRAPDDYALLDEIYGVILPEYPSFGDHMRTQDERRKPPARYRRWIVEREGKAVACADYRQENGMYHPRKFNVEVMVLPEHRNRGLGGALFDHVMETLEEFDPWIVRGDGREDMLHSTRWLEARGFSSIQRYEEWRLDLSTWNPEDWADELQAALDGGLRIATLAELESEPDMRRRFFELRDPLVEEVPRADRRTPPTFEEFQERVFDKPTYCADGMFIGILDGEWIGVSELWLGTGSDPNLWIGLTGVRSEYRGKGVASALKIAAINWAKERGAPFCVTWVEEANRPMLGINTRMGFKTRPAWVTWEKEVGEPDPA